MSMFSLPFLAVPPPDAKEFLDSGGAYVSCWIQGGDRQEAEQRATDLIQEYGWAVEGLEEGAVVPGADYAADDEDRQLRAGPRRGRGPRLQHLAPRGRRGR